MSQELPTEKQALFSRIPKVDECLTALHQRCPELASAPRSLLRRAVREVLDECRRQILAAGAPAAADCSIPLLLPRFVRRVEALSLPRFRRVINASGVVIHTNLGRSLLPREALQPLLQAACRYGNLEFDLDSGRRGSRYSLVEDLLCELTGAEAALVVNNNAAAVLLALEALARGREVIVSRGQLVEIGGSFRIPDVMARSGALLVEVGATNRTHLRDYEAVIRPETGLLLRVHNSNFRIIGFTSEVPAGDLVALGARHGVPVMEDLGSGCFVDLSRFGLEKEPTVQETVRAGVDVVTFSGDKLLGGPQAGIILGRRALIDQIKKNPLNRALRIDKFTLASLEAVLRLYRDEATALAAIPTLAMIATPVAQIERRARRLLRRLAKRIGTLCDVRLCETVSRVGGGALPEQNLPSRAVALVPRHGSPQRLEAALRRLPLPVIGRIENEQLLLDMRTVADDELDALADCLTQALAQLPAAPGHDRVTGA